MLWYGFLNVSYLLEFVNLLGSVTLQLSSNVKNFHHCLLKFASVFLLTFTHLWTSNYMYDVWFKVSPELYDSLCIVFSLCSMLDKCYCHSFNFTRFLCSVWDMVNLTSCIFYFRNCKFICRISYDSLKISSIISVLLDNIDI
jgi:hypothetical protein